MRPGLLRGEALSDSQAAGEAVELPVDREAARAESRALAGPCG
eukprot:CAMPEP_0180140684 /NCGR_PEP_ID=MMETSP0986-20121125/14399_1 /TAXON_ID=697907 /ORGANISM="non described non described, Strain CCMP2293" /LENGTH=42 /DNA_ID= /DNA_START= /DNA_END= /DNA_ORIENTATION=